LFPAQALEQLIRMAGIGTAAHSTWQKLALAPEILMTLIGVKQKSKGASRKQAQPDLRRFPPVCRFFTPFSACREQNHAELW
jgi:hypothetical protein